MHHFWLELTPECNLDCQFCYNSWSLSSIPRSISSVAHRFADFLSNFPGCGVTHAGGEPLRFKDLDLLTSLLNQLRILQGIVTNGVDLDYKRTKKLYRHGVRLATISIHSAYEDEHDQLVGRPCWKRAVAGLLNAVEAGMRTAVAAVVCKKNVNRLTQLYDLAVYSGADELILNKYIASGRGAAARAELALTDREFADAVARVLARTSDGRIIVSLGIPALVPGSIDLPRLNCGSCPVSTHQTRFVLDFLGRVRRCSSSEKSVGTIDDPAVVAIVRNGIFSNGWRKEQDGWRGCAFN